jgi:hypothetical protein
MFVDIREYQLLINPANKAFAESMPAKIAGCYRHF